MTDHSFIDIGLDWIELFGQLRACIRKVAPSLVMTDDEAWDAVKNIFIGLIALLPEIPTDVDANWIATHLDEAMLPRDLSREDIHGALSGDLVDATVARAALARLREELSSDKLLLNCILSLLH